MANKWSYEDYADNAETVAAKEELDNVIAQKPGEYVEGASVTNAYNALNSLQKPGEYQSQWQQNLNDTMNKILNREKFTYDVNGDALYQQYKDQYVTQGKMAMMDTMGQAAAMTGGYGNSYAQSVGQQAYQGYLQQLTDKVPELYQLALNKYNQEGEELYNQYGLFADADDRDYGRYRDTVSDYYTDRGYYTDLYNNERNFDYGKYRDTVSNWQYDYSTANDNYWNNKNFGYNQWSDDRNLSYTQFNADREYDLAVEQLKAANSGGGSGGGNGGSGAGTYTNTLWYDTGTFDADGNKVFRNSDGKTQSFGAGVNPYTGTINPDAKGGNTFSNGYQPDNIGGVKLKKATKNGAVIYTNETGKEQAVWTANGRYYLWRGDLNRYEEVEDPTK